MAHERSKLMSRDKHASHNCSLPMSIEGHTFASFLKGLKRRLSLTLIRCSMHIDHLMSRLQKASCAYTLCKRSLCYVYHDEKEPMINMQYHVGKP